MRVRIQQIDVDFQYSVSFTDRVLSPANPALRLALERHGAGPHRVVAVIDDGALTAWPSLRDDVVAYAAAHADVMTLMRPPFLFDGGEACKNDPVAPARLHRLLCDSGIDRRSFVIAIGGGALLDMIGYAAATAHRGVRLIRVPTTVVAQAESAVGVRCGINAFGVKDFLGVYAPPAAVLIDPGFLFTLPRRELAAGMTKAIRIALLRDRGLFEWIESNVKALANGSVGPVTWLVRRAAELHIDHLLGSGDPFERGDVRPLELGQWAAHKLESISEHTLAHGEAFAIGLALDAQVSVAAGLLSPSACGRLVDVLERLGLSLWHEGLAMTRGERLIVLDGLEEQRAHGLPAITLLKDIGGGVEARAVDQTHLRGAVAWLEARARTAPACVVG